jgi:hypothetical protein
MAYRENPKTKGSGIITCIPQKGTCPNKCEDCFFQSGRSYLEPLDENLPNMPTAEMAKGRIVRVNDGNDSNVQRKKVIEAVKDFPMKFYNTAIPWNLGEFGAPVVLTVNPGIRTDKSAYLIEFIPKNLMFVRVRVNAWNLELVDRVAEHYSRCEVPVILTFMRYYTEVLPKEHEIYYTFRKNIINSYWKITKDGWNMIMARYQYNHLVHSCGIEGEKGTSACRHCGNCIREYFATMERLRMAEQK